MGGTPTVSRLETERAQGRTLAFQLRSTSSPPAKSSEVARAGLGAAVSVTFGASDVNVTVASPVAM